jgi:hypothetical protein
MRVTGKRPISAHSPLLYPDAEANRVLGHDSTRQVDATLSPGVVKSEQLSVEQMCGVKGNDLKASGDHAAVT